MAEPLNQRHCEPCEGGIPPLSAAVIGERQREIAPRWRLLANGSVLSAEFSFRNYPQTTAFVNAVAAIAERENHHPDIRFGYRHCEVHWTTHAAQGLTDNDFICAAKVDALCDMATTGTPS